MAHPEALLLSALINSSDVLAGEQLGLTPAMFHEYREEYEWLISYKLKYRAEPSFSAFKGQFPDFHLLEHQDVCYGVQVVQDSHLKHQLSKLLRKSAQEIKTSSPGEVLAELQSESLKIASGFDTGVSMSNSITDYSASLDYALERDASETPLGIPFAHQTLQNYAYGQQGGDLTVFAARLNQGKSWILINESAQAVLSGKKVLYFSLEMNKRAMEYRFQTIFARHFGKPFTHTMLHHGRGLDLLEYKQFLQFMSDNVPGELLINDTSRGQVTPTSVAAAVNKHSPDLVVIDYLTLMGSSAGVRASEGWQVVASITGDLKNVATSFDTAVLTASQINREGDTSNWRPPVAKNLSQSDSVGQDADNVITMKRFGKGAMVYSLEKSRNSQAQCLWWSVFDPEHGTFTEISREAAEAARSQEEYDEDEHY